MRFVNLSFFVIIVSNCPRCQIVLSVKLSSLHGRCQIVLFCMVVSNCPRCQIVLGVKLSSLHGRCQIVLGVKLSHHRVMMVMTRTMMMVKTKNHLLHPSLLLLPPFSSHLPACIFCQNIVKYLSTLLLNILICYFSIYQYSLLPSSHHIDNILIDPIPTKKDLILRAHFLN